MTTQINPGELFAVKGMVALVTGGGTGIGLMMAKALADAGASKVYIVGRRKEALDAAAEQINKKDVVVPLVGDVSSKSSLSSIASSITKDTGYLNLVVCNAGISGPQGRMPEPETTLEEWQQKQLSFDTEEYTNTFNVNSTSVWYTAISMLKLLDEGNKKGNLKQSSQVVVTSSIASFNKKAPGGWAYGQSKAAATLASKQLSVALRQWDIRCNCICPGLFPSEMSAPIVEKSGGKVSDLSAAVPVPKEMVPMGRMGTPEEMAGQILYLASPAGAYLNGNVIVVDGGRLTTMPTTGY